MIQKYIPKGLLIYYFLYYIQDPVFSTLSLSKKDEINKIKILGLNPSNKSEIKQIESSQYEFENNEDKILKFILKKDCECIEIKHQDQSVWKYDETQCKNKYPKHIFYYLDSKTMFISSENNLFVFKLDDTKWKSIFEGEPELLELDIKTKESDLSCDYSKDDKTKLGTFKTKEGYLIKAIKRSKSTPCCCNPDDSFWEANDESEYANKVVVNGTESLKKTDDVIIYLLNGEVKSFHKNCWRAWKEKSTKTEVDV